MQPFGVVYVITHLETGRVYVGQTRQPLQTRWAQHRSQPGCVRLHRAIKRYGADAFTIGVVAIADSTESLDAAEQFYIGQMRAADRAFGFNLMTGSRGGAHTAEALQKMSQKVRAAWQDPAKRARWTEARKRPCARKTAAKISVANTGKRHSPETLSALSEFRRGLLADPAKRAAQVAYTTAGKRRPEARAAAADKTRTQWADPEQRAKILAAQAEGKKAFWSDPVKKAERIAKRAATLARKRAEQEKA